MKKALSILLTLALALSLTVTALAGGNTTPPSGSNVIKLTCTDEGEYKGDLYMVFSQLTKAGLTDNELWAGLMEYYIPVGSTITCYWYYNGEFKSLDPDGEPAALLDVYFIDYFSDETGEAYSRIVVPESRTNSDGTITLTFEEPGRYTFECTDSMGYYWLLSPQCDIIVEGTATPTDPTPEPEMPFTDVPNWCAEAAAYMAAHNIMNGTGDNKFSPNENTTRGMAMTILARAAGVNTDDSDPWYQVGMEWSVSAKISDGTNPTNDVKRQELATMIWRYFKEPACDKTPDFPDVSSVSDYAVTAMNWCVDNGIINGKDGLLDPKGFATRAEAATMVYRALTKFAS